MSDLSSRLRAVAYGPGDIAEQAADEIDSKDAEITRLRAEVERLRSASQPIIRVVEDRRAHGGKYVDKPASVMLEAKLLLDLEAALTPLRNHHMEMTEDIAIPPETIEAAAKATHDKWRHDCAAHEKEPVENWLEWHELKDFEQEYWRRQAHASCLAMLRNWPGVQHDPGALVTDTYRDPGKIILPLPQEPRT